MMPGLRMAAILSSFAETRCYKSDPVTVLFLLHGFGKPRHILHCLSLGSKERF